ncbi:uncharacterized protein VTP21DRAFT_9279 [Calcarisporiella thermophila]|uniref:uncharacterized protein n=1 Tax=Calcarisporiella thermophila TaxID=911321 RepID=UPI003743F5BD
MIVYERFRRYHRNGFLFTTSQMSQWICRYVTANLARISSPRRRERRLFLFPCPTAAPCARLTSRCAQCYWAVLCWDELYYSLLGRLPKTLCTPALSYHRSLSAPASPSTRTLIILAALSSFTPRFPTQTQSLRYACIFHPAPSTITLPIPQLLPRSEPTRAPKSRLTLIGHRFPPALSLPRPWYGRLTLTFNLLPCALLNARLHSPVLPPNSVCASDLACARWRNHPPCPSAPSRSLCIPGFPSPGSASPIGPQERVGRLGLDSRVISPAVFGQSPHSVESNHGLTTKLASSSFYKGWLCSALWNPFISPGGQARCQWS